MRKNVLSISLYKFKNEVHVRFHDRVILLIDEKGYETLPLMVFLPLYKERVDAVKTALNYLKGSELTVQIVEMDQYRGTIFRGFYDTVKGFRNHFDPELRKSANTLWPLFVAYGNVTHKRFEAETTAVNDFLEELKRPVMEAALKALGLEVWPVELGVTNQRFEALVMERSSEMVHKGALQMRSCRSEVDRCYRAMVSALEDHVLLEEPNEAYKAFISELNGIIVHFKGILAQEYGRSRAATSGKGPTQTGEAGKADKPATDGGEEGPEA